MAKRRAASPAEAVLGELIKKLRLKQGLSCLQLGRKVNVFAQQIEKYEKGDFIPIPMLEKLGIALGGRVDKKIIRKISRLRTCEAEDHTDEQETLTELYQEAFDEENF
jgi:transcriptional regulator with XRE-family HTH domain